jgi:hypothetical protein
MSAVWISDILTVPYLCNSCVSAQFEFYAGQNSVYPYMYRNCRLQHTGTWLASAWPPYHLCYYPREFFCSLFLIALSFPQGEIWFVFKKTLVLETFFLPFYCIILALCNLKFYKSQIVCTSFSCWMWTTKLDSKKCWKCFNALD